MRLRRCFWCVSEYNQWHEERDELDISPSQSGTRFEISTSIISRNLLLFSFKHYFHLLSNCTASNKKATTWKIALTFVWRWRWWTCIKLHQVALLTPTYTGRFFIHRTMNIQTPRFPLKEKWWNTWICSGIIVYFVAIVSPHQLPLQNGWPRGLYKSWF